MSFGQEFLQGFFGTKSLKDYTHASKTFVTNGYELAPRTKFLFHVYFNLNTVEIPALKKIYQQGNDAKTLGLMVKNVTLPSFQLDVDTMNQYNRKRLVQKKIEYQPVNLTLHDDGGDLIRTMWYNYFSYYYKDPSQQYWDPRTMNGSMGNSGNGGDLKASYNSRDIYSDNRIVNDWGYVGESYLDGQAGNRGKAPFFRDITIFGMNQKKFVAYVLINPLITEWQHDTYDYSQGNGMMENKMTVRYETVKYYTGPMGQVDRAGGGDKNVTGFGSFEHYDQERSSLLRPGSVNSVLGPGGLIDTVGGITADLQSGSVLGIIGAVQKAGTAYQTFKGTDLKSTVREEANIVAKNVIRGQLPGAVKSTINAADGFFFPKAPIQSNSTTVTPATPKAAPGTQTPPTPS